MDSGITWHKSSYSGTENAECVEVGDRWHKSSYSGDAGNCVEVGAAWHKSTYSGANGECVEVADNLPDVVYVRDTKTRDRLTLAFGPAAWAGFLTEVKAGRYDPPAE